MATNDHRSYVYVGLAGEAGFPGAGGLYRYAVQEGSWESVGGGLPPEPQVRALLVHPTEPAVLYAGTQHGLFRSDDRGDHWEQLTAPVEGHDLWSLVCHPRQPEILYAGYGPCAIWRSDDGGAHWRRLDTDRVQFPHITTYLPPTAKRVLGLAIDPSNPLDLYAAIEVGGLLGSGDGGESWTQLIDGPYVRNNTLDLHAVQVSAAAPGTVFVATQIALFRGRNRGRRWEHIQIDELFPGGAYCRDLLVAPDDPRSLYLAAGAGGNAAPAGTPEAGALYRSRDAGETWTRLDLGTVPPSRLARLAIDRAAPATVSCCTMRGHLFVSRDGGERWRATQVPLVLTRERHVYALACG